MSFAKCVFALVVLLCVPPAWAGEGASASPGPYLEKALAQPLDVPARRWTFPALAREIQGRASVRVAYPLGLESGPAFAFESTGQNLGAVLELLTKQQGLESGCYEQTVVFWKPCDNKLLENLATVMQGGEPAERRDAVAQLGALADRRIYPLLFKGLEDRQLCDAVCKTLVSRHKYVLRFADGTGPATEALVKQLQDAPRNDSVEPQILVLGALGRPLGIRVLEGLVDSPDAGTRGRALRALGLAGPAAFDVLAARLKNDDPMDRIWTAESLGETGDPRAWAPLVEFLRDRDAALRSAGARALARLPDERADDAVAQLLQDANAIVRVNAVEALSLIGSPGAVQALTEALPVLSRDKEVGWAAAPALGRVFGAAPFEALQPLLKSEDLETRLFALRILGESRTDDAAKELRQRLDDAEPRVRTAALEALGRNAGPCALEVLAKLAQKSPLNLDRVAVMESYRAAREIAGVARSAAYRRDPRLTQIRAWMVSREPGALPRLLSLVQDPDPDVRALAAMALRRWTPKDEEEGHEIAAVLAKLGPQPPVAGPAIHKPLRRLPATTTETPVETPAETPPEDVDF